MSTDYMRIVGPNYCVRCDFQTDASAPFGEQDAALMAHLNEKHPGWMTDGGKSIIKERLSVSDADKIAAKDVEIKRLKALLREYREYVSVSHEQCAVLHLPELRCGLCRRTDKELGE